MIVLEHLSFAYPGRADYAFCDLNLLIESGTWVAAMGPDGAGKTTLGKLVKGLILPDAGSVWVGLVRDSEEPVVGYLGGDPYDYLVGTSVQEDMVFGLENLGLPKAEMRNRLESALRLTGLAGMEQRLTHTLSGGEQQKLCLAAFLAMGAQVLVLDEALSMLDRPTRRSVRSLISRIQRDSRLTVIEITQDLEEALAADRLLFLQNRTIQYDGLPHDFLATPLGRNWASLQGGLPALRAGLESQGLKQVLPERVLDALSARLAHTLRDER